MPAGERRLWWCRHGHVLGEVKHALVGQRRVRALMLYEVSVLLENVPAELPTLRGRVTAGMDDIRCTICGAVKSWEVGEDALEALFERRQARET
jgi:hypothetical protein